MSCTRTPRHRSGWSRSSTAAVARRRDRVISEPHRRRFLTVNAVIPGAVLVDGFAIGSWRMTTDGKMAVLVIRPFERVPRAAIPAIEAEGRRLLEFARPEAAARDVRFAAVTG